MKQPSTILLLIFFTFLYSTAVFSQQLVPPLQIPPALSANFGELRNNHFHSGLDYKTQGEVNIPVYSVDEGYVSRINVSPGGFGMALYINHPSGYTSVYAHLNSFSKKIADYIRTKQYEAESFRVDVSLKAGEIPVKKGEQIALSGNSGASGGAHLHFEIRDTKTENPIDVLDFLGNTMKDTLKPEIQALAFYPLEGKGIVNGSINPVRITIGQSKSGIPLKPAKTINAWGTLGVGVKAYDRMNGTTNHYGVKFIRLFVDGNRIFSSSMDRYSFDKTRMLNSFIDFEDWRKNKSFYMKSYVEPGNTLPLYKTLNNGYIDINTEKDYLLRYELEDNFGNILTYSFVVKGQRQVVLQKSGCTNFMAWNKENSYVNTDFKLTIPIGNLYTDICYTHRRITSFAYYSDLYQVNDKPIPLNTGAQVRIKLNARKIADTSKLGIVEIAKTGKEEWIGGKFKNEGVETIINELGGQFAIGIDTVAPKITAMKPELWVKNQRIIIKLTDDKSGIATYRGEIDGKFALFTSDVKSNQCIYVFDNTRLSKKQQHTFVFSAVDAVGNKSEYKYEFSY